MSESESESEETCGMAMVEDQQVKQEIVDAHMHLWSPSTHPWVEKVKDGGHPAGKFGMNHLFNKSEGTLRMRHVCIRVVPRPDHIK